MVWVGGKLLVSCCVFKVINWFVVAEIGGILGGSSQDLDIWFIKHGDRLLPPYGSGGGIPSKRSFMDVEP